MGGNSTTALAIAKARTAFLTNTTASNHATRNAFLGSPPLSSPSWKLRQLYGLCEMLTAHAEELVECLRDQYAFPPNTSYQEFALVLEDIARHYTNLSQGSTENKVRQCVWGTVKETDFPVGVSLLLFDTVNPIRFLFSSLASNIALGNTVLLANLSSDDCNRIWLLLKRELPKYLDSEAIIVLEKFEPDPSLLDRVDLISLFAEQSDCYHSLVGRSNTQFISTKATSVVVVDEGNKSHEQVTSKIFESFSFRRLRPESTNAVFVRDADFPSFQEAFGAVATNLSPFPGSAKALSNLKGFSRLLPTVYWAELSIMFGQTKKLDINTAFDTADSAGILLVISYRSIDQVIEALNGLKEPPKYLTFLAPFTKENGDYFQKWTKSEFFSLGSIRSAIPYAPNSDVLFPTRIFGKTRVCLSGSESELPASYEAILKRVHASVKKPKDAPNQTLDFFGYMQRVAVGTGIFIMGASASGIYMWYNRRAR